MAPQDTVVLPHALHIPGINKLAGKRVILASGSPRRKEILQIFVRSWVLESLSFRKITCGLRRDSPPKSYPPSLPKISTPHHSNIFTSTPSLLRRTKPLRCTSGSLCVSTLSRISFLIASSNDDIQRADPDNGPDLVIGADTVVLTHAQPVTSDVAYSELPGVQQELLEKPENKVDNLRMLQELNGTVCEVVTGVSLGE
jgi:septum formation protein